MVFHRLRGLREDANLNQTEMGAILNITQRAYSHYETGDIKMPLELLSQFADYFHTSTDYILNRTDILEPYPKPKSNR